MDGGVKVINTAKPIVNLSNFINSIRDSGYKGTYSALAELVDNAIEANATRVDVILKVDSSVAGGEMYPISVCVVDNGDGMTPTTLQYALQLGGSTRFDSRTGLGRYGMGLPNSSLNQARRVNVLTWTTQKNVWQSYLDVDEITDGLQLDIARPTRTQLSKVGMHKYSNSGTIVAWTKCDQLSSCRIKVLEKQLHRR